MFDLFSLWRLLFSVNAIHKVYILATIV